MDSILKSACSWNFTQPSSTTMAIITVIIILIQVTECLQPGDPWFPQLWQSLTRMLCVGYSGVLVQRPTTSSGLQRREGDPYLQADLLRQPPQSETRCLIQSSAGNGGQMGVQRRKPKFKPL